MFHRELGQDRDQSRNTNLTADDAGAAEAGVPRANLGDAADTAATTDFAAGNLCNLCKSVAQ
jgi:hypothetical protein